MKVVVIGGNAAGMSAASRIKRKSPADQVVVLESTEEVSYGACGLPYYVAGLNNDIDLIRIRRPSEFREAGVELNMGRLVERVDYAGKTVSGRDMAGQPFCEAYDKLLIATGSSPKIPPIPGIQQAGIFALKTLEQAEQLKQAIQQNPGHVVIVGGGYIGLELAEACLLRKVKSVRVVEALDRLINTFDPEFGAAAGDTLRQHGVSLHLGERVLRFEGTGTVTQVVTDQGTYPADLVVLSIGITPNTGFLDHIEKLPNGALVVNTAMETSVPDVYAAGDCATVWHRILQKPMSIALGTNANKQGRLAGDSILGKPVCFDRALGTAMLRCMTLELAKTGLSEQEARAAGIPFQVNTVQSRSHARYYPDASMITIKLCYRQPDHVLLGAQIMGEKEAAWRIDALACAVDRGMTTEELGFLDLGYAPPFASVWDAVNIAANASK